MQSTAPDSTDGCSSSTGLIKASSYDSYASEGETAAFTAVLHGGAVATQRVSGPLHAGAPNLARIDEKQQGALLVQLACEVPNTKFELPTRARECFTVASGLVPQRLLTTGSAHL